MTAPFNAGSYRLSNKILLCQTSHKGAFDGSFTQVRLKYFLAGIALLRHHLESAVYRSWARGAAGGPMNSSIIKRSIVIGGHKTSVSLEDPFWNDLKRIAHAKRVTLSELIAQIDGARKQSNLSSAIRLFVLEHFQNENKRVDVTDARRASASAEETQATRP